MTMNNKMNQTECETYNIGIFCWVFLNICRKCIKVLQQQSGINLNQTTNDN